jgi:transcriptional regulator
MYTPKHFQNHNTAEIKEFIQQYGFGILVSQGSESLQATHIPLELSADETKLTAHISRGNPQWKNIESVKEILAIFSGPHSYISSSWYNHENVPTWNYIAVHVYGTIRIVEGEALRDSLKHLVNKYEKDSEKPVSLESLSPDYVNRALQGIVGLEISITRIEASYKLSQNRDDENYNNVIHELEKRKDENASQVASIMKKNRCPVTHS